MVPMDLTYPELIPASLHEPLLHAPVFYEGEDDLFKKMKRLLDHKVKPLPPATLKSINRHLDWHTHVLEIDQNLEKVSK